MAFYDGLDGAVYFATNQVAEVRDATYDEAADNTEVPAMGVQEKRYSIGPKGGTGSFNMNYDHTDSTGQDSVSVGDTVELHLYPGGNTSGFPDLNGTVTIVGESVAMDVADAAQRTYEFVGVLTRDSVTP